MFDNKEEEVKMGAMMMIMREGRHWMGLWCRFAFVSERLICAHSSSFMQVHMSVSWWVRWESIRQYIGLYRPESRYNKGW